MSEYFNFVKCAIENIKTYINDINNDKANRSVDDVHAIELLMNEYKSNLETFPNLDKIALLLDKVIIEITPIAYVENMTRSFTYVDAAKQKRIELLQMRDEIYNKLNDETEKFVSKIKLNTDAEIKAFVNNLNDISLLTYLMTQPKVANNKYVLDYLESAKNKLFTAPDMTPTASILIRTWPTRDIADAKITNPTSICTGQVMKYNLQGFTSAGWVAKNKVNEPNNAGLSDKTITRQAVIQKLPSKSFEIALGELGVTYGNDIYEVENINIYHDILAINKIIDIDIPLNPVRDESKSNTPNLVNRIKITVHGAIEKWARTGGIEKIKKCPDVKCITKELNIVAIPAIKDALFVSSDDEDILLSYISILMECYRRFDNSLKVSMDILDKSDIVEIIQNLTSKAIDDFARQPSPLDMI